MDDDESSPPEQPFSIEAVLETLLHIKAVLGDHGMTTAAEHVGQALTAIDELR